MNNQYPELYASYQWFVPTQFNIAQACVHRWAQNPHESRRIAFYFEDELERRETWSYARLSETTNQLANGLIKMGVAPNDRVVVAMGQRPEAATAYMAILSVGAIVVPLNTKLQVNDLTERLRDAQARVAIVDADAGPDILQAQIKCPLLTQIIGLGFVHDTILPWHSLLARQATTFKTFQTKSSDPALLLYTTPADGPLKGSLLTHGALIGILPGFVASQDWFPQTSDVFWTPSDWAKANGLLNALLPTLYFGRAIVGNLGQFSINRALSLLERYQVTNAFLSSMPLTALLNEAQTLSRNRQLALRSIATTDTNLGIAEIRSCQKALSITPNLIFGRIETNYIIGNSCHKWPTKFGSIGRPYPGHLVTVLNAGGTPCATDTIGEIALNRYDIHGHADPVLFSKYWNNEAATQAKFVGDWCLTGALGKIDKDGYFWYAGHHDDTIKTVPK